MKKTLCLIGQGEVVCSTLCRQLQQLLGEYVTVSAWCLDLEQMPPTAGFDLYLASYHEALTYARRHLPPESVILCAGRFINPCSFDLLLDLAPGTRAILVGNSQDRVEHLQQGITDFGVTHVTFVPHYPNNPNPLPREVTLAVTAGKNKHIPSWVTEVIDLGVKELTLMTYAEILAAFSVPSTVLNKIAFTYMESVFRCTRRHHQMKKKAAALVENVDEAIVSFNAQGEIDDANAAALRMFSGLGEPGRLRLQDLFPELRYGGAPFSTDEDTITRVGDNYYVVRVKMLDDEENTLGAVMNIKPVSKVQELENKVRRELKGVGNKAKYSFEQIFGSSKVLQHTVSRARRFAATEIALLLEGESGVGKELFAQSIHQLSPRRHGPFVAINFAALPETLVESELFGYEDGAFTGARRGGKAGLFEQAHNGTIFLDELGDASLEAQTKLLRVLEEKEVRRIGGSGVLPVNVRVIAATNRSLSNMVQAKMFRADLFYRICICPLLIPPLRKRGNDVFLLAEHFARERFSRSLILSPRLQAFFSGYGWPGNVRELQNVVTYLCTVGTEGRPCSPEDLPYYMSEIESAGAFSLAGEQREEDFFIRELSRKNMLPLVREILSAYNRAGSQSPMGRYSLATLLKERGHSPQPHTLRAAISLLKERAFLESGVTKQGTKITPPGQEFLRYLQTHPS